MRDIKLDDYEKELVVYAREISFYLQKSGAFKEEADDVSQDVLLKMLESDLILPLNKIRAWMYRTAVRQYIDHYRRQQKYQDILQNHFFNDKTPNKFDFNYYTPVYKAIESLKKHDQMVLDLYYFQNFSVKEISTILHYSTSKVKVDLMRARKKLKRELEKEAYIYEDFN
ncbi:sigma-70 family RNA polymerase sigma factor [Streptococcus urinalis FB127-CNA-2]|uniref:Sigma-70, region 4 n=1 Tax=Streptococcus urinalis 2285-97 TaxID=764291 RepID=G5KHH3_9STRE|nr:sigma-70 family RNA polymerase sigma factor [Streptococcus urinalis]EHJ57697.1 sigma-70, region 4 [Streptococcus urinalis 2285-97]EKS22530.1 sigma-70 family RNA polymerase sigma factor [Streptococcus urinalis FB127-CNA-2]VEF32343.1 ECF subfamily RNA polymerase sigma-70 factor [Streptococcus urinalis]